MTPVFEFSTNFQKFANKICFFFFFFFRKPVPAAANSLKSFQIPFG